MLNLKLPPPQVTRVFLTSKVMLACVNNEVHAMTIAPPVSQNCLTSYTVVAKWFLYFKLTLGFSAGNIFTGVTKKNRSYSAYLRDLRNKRLMRKMSDI